MTRPHARMRQRGQATVEFVVLALVLVPFAISLGLLGRYLDMMNATEQASRYVAFEAVARNSSSSWKGEAELAEEVRRRFFSTADAPIKTGDTAGDFTAHRNPLWTDHAGRPLLDDFAAQVTVQTGVQGRNALPFVRPWTESFGLSDQNWYTGTVALRPRDVPNFLPFDALGLNIRRRTVILADAWTAYDAAQVRNRIEGSNMAYPVRQLQPLLDALGTVPTLVFDPAVRLGEFDWDVVPCDRLLSPTAGQPGGCAP